MNFTKCAPLLATIFLIGHVPLAIADDFKYLGTVTGWFNSETPLYVRSIKSTGYDVTATIKVRMNAISSNLQTSRVIVQCGEPISGPLDSPALFKGSNELGWALKIRETYCKKP